MIRGADEEERLHYNLWSCPWSWLRSSGGPRVGCLVMYCFLFLLGEVYKEAKGIAQVMVANELEARNGNGEAPKAPQEPKRAEAKKPAKQKRSKSKTSGEKKKKPRRRRRLRICQKDTD
ncbi:hypothetical protein SUGI_1075870 [Cryptomeria japonica]|nr:hypothetical protein SUGI_1075870 [Cryptomeria japonica]